MGEARLAADRLDKEGHSTTVADARFMKPLDKELILQLAREHEILITVEEGGLGGFGAHVLHFLAEEGVLDAGLKVRTLTLPDIFIDQDSPERMYDTAGLNSDNIYDTVKDVIGRSEKTIIDLNPKRA